MEDLEKAIIKIFYDDSNRPKITPRHETAIVLMLENTFTPRQIRYSLNKLQRKRIINSLTYRIKQVGPSRFYFVNPFHNEVSMKKIHDKVRRYSDWIRRYSDNRITKMLGEHLHDLVKAELRAQSFDILIEGDIKKFEGKDWKRSNHRLDLIARHKQKSLTIGVEIKNTLYPISKQEILTKICMCEFFGIRPVFACRGMEPHRKIIENNNGFLWQFKQQLYPRGQENLVDILKKRFKFPVAVSGEIPQDSVNHLIRWIDGF